LHYRLPVRTMWSNHLNEFFIETPNAKSI